MGCKFLHSTSVACSQGMTAGHDQLADTAGVAGIAGQSIRSLLALTHSLHLQGLSPLILPVPRPQGCSSCFVGSVDNSWPLAQQLMGVLQRGVLITWIILCRMRHISAGWPSVCAGTETKVSLCRHTGAQLDSLKCPAGWWSLS